MFFHGAHQDGEPLFLALSPGMVRVCLFRHQKPHCLSAELIWTLAL